MDLTLLTGSLGVFLLLLAFLLNLFRYLSQESTIYKLLNVAGAGLSGYASWLLHFIPFVVLEGIWCLVAALSLLRNKMPAER